jgi:integrase
LPLPKYIIDLLLKRKSESKGKYVFPGYNPNKALVSSNRQVKKVIIESGVNFLLHDLRRTFATYADSLEIKHTTIKRLMNHKDNDVTTKHYIQPSIERLREPMDEIANYILSKTN